MQITTTQPLLFVPRPYQFGPTRHSLNQNNPSSAFSPISTENIQKHHEAEYQILSKQATQLELIIKQGQQEHKIMLDLFKQICLAEQGQLQLIKKCKRRTPNDIVVRHYCPHSKCGRFYSSASALKRHIRLKHDQIGTDPPQKFHDLHPEPNLNSQHSIYQSESQQSSIERAIKNDYSHSEDVQTIKIKLK